MLPVAGAHARRADGRHLAADRPDEGPDRLPGRPRRAGGAARLEPRPRRIPAHVRRPPRAAERGCSTCRPSGWATSDSCNCLERQSISLLAVDEAHCISEWGHNFRPDYLKIAALAQQLHVGRVLALTATATPDVATDIAAAFEIEAGRRRANRFLSTQPGASRHACADEKRIELLAIAPALAAIGPTIVYVTLQRTASKSPLTCRSAASRPAPITPACSADDRNEIQDAFMAADDMIVVATIAFGMGIDKSNIRAVYHYNLPKSLESYMQEIGRAGRDGEPAVCEMLACADDIVTLENFTYGDTPEPETVAALVDELSGSTRRVRRQRVRPGPAARCARSGREDVAHVPGAGRRTEVDRPVLHRIQISTAASIDRDSGQV